MEEIELLITKAEEWDYESQIKLSRYYLFGKIVKEDLKQGLFWLEKAAKQNHISDLLQLEFFYQYGIGTHIDYKKVHEYREQQINLGCLKCLFEKALKLFRKKSYNSALKLFSNCSDGAKRYPDAEYFCGICFIYGLGVEIDKYCAAYCIKDSLDSPRYGASALKLWNKHQLYKALVDK